MHKHVEVYIDESGDLGFSARSTRYFVVAALALPEPDGMTRVVKRIRRRHFLRFERSMEFKFNRSSESARRLLLDGIASTVPSISWGGIVKENTPKALRDDKNALYGHLCCRTAMELTRNLRSRSIRIVLDRRSGNRSVRRNLEVSLERAVVSRHPGHFPPEVVISHTDSMACGGLQAADFVAGAVFQELERSNPTYLDRIRGSVVHGELYW